MGGICFPSHTTRGSGSASIWNPITGNDLLGIVIYVGTITRLGESLTWGGWASSGSVGFRTARPRAPLDLTASEWLGIP